MKKKTLFIAATITLVMAFIVGALVYNAQQEEQPNNVVVENTKALVRPHSPTLGRADAPVVIVEFFDPACETCWSFYPRVKDILAANRQDTKLVLRYAPFHTGSDKVVAVLEAARKQGQFWEALEALMASQASWTAHHQAKLDLVWGHLEGLGLDLDQLRADMNSPEIAAVISQDLADARALNVTMTPEFFVNGRPMPSFGLRQLHDLVNDELAKVR